MKSAPIDDPHGQQTFTGIVHTNTGIYAVLCNGVHVMYTIR